MVEILCSDKGKSAIKWPKSEPPTLAEILKTAMEEFPETPLKELAISSVDEFNDSTSNPVCLRKLE